MGNDKLIYSSPLSVNDPRCGAETDSVSILKRANPPPNSELLFLWPWTLWAVRAQLQRMWGSLPKGGKNKRGERQKKDQSCNFNLWCHQETQPAACWWHHRYNRYHLRFIFGPKQPQKSKFRWPQIQWFSFRVDDQLSSRPPPPAPHPNHLPPSPPPPSSLLTP